jgi:hypothetical protein
MSEEELNMTIPEFQKKFNTNEVCREHLYRIRWPGGAGVPEMREEGILYNHEAERVRTRRLRKPQVFDLMVFDLMVFDLISLTAGTIMHRSHTPLIKWFWAVYMTARDKRGVSAVRLQREPEVSYPTAWRGNFVSECREKYGKGRRTGIPCTNSPGRRNLTKVTSEGLRKAGNAGAGRIKHPSRSRYRRISRDTPGMPKWKL